MARIAIVQFAGDFLEAYNRLRDSNTEIYYGHRYVLDQLETINSRFGPTMMMCCTSHRRYREQLPSGLQLIGAAADPRTQFRLIKQHLVDFNPTHLLVLGPLTAVIRWGVSTERRVVCLFADSFNTGPIYRFLKYGRLTSLLNRRDIEWIGNHGINACLSLARIGVQRDKIVPWDWPHMRRPDDYPPKPGPQPGIPTLVYVGLLTRSKGIGDVIAAVAELRKRQLPVRLKIAGGGNTERYKGLAEKLAVAGDVEFLGLIPNESVLKLMKEASLVVVPSHHRYPEGLPLTIYEALCARTPIVASDHPMFANHLRHGESAMIYPAGQPGKLADRVKQLLEDRSLYGRLSLTAADTWQRIQIPVKWGEFITRWLKDDAEDRHWLYQHRLDSGAYTNHLGH